MKPDILTKLAAELAAPIVSERQVVYIMVEIRKLLELSGDKRLYRALVFHCDWVAHPALDRALANEIVLAFNQEARKFDGMSKLKVGGTMQSSTDHLRVLAPTVTLTNFRNDLNNYLCHHGLDNSIPGEDPKWANFLRYYGEVIRDCPLRCEGNNQKFIDEVFVEVDEVAEGTTKAFGFSLRLRWTWKNKVTGQKEFKQQFY